MYLREVTLRNWRSYRSSTFELAEPKGKKRVVLVGAMNGTGKTSLLVALYLGLFGREAMPFVEGFRRGYTADDRSRSYRKLMEWILHRPSQEDEDPHAFVQLRLTTDNDEEVSITRTWHFTRGGRLRDPDSRDGEEVRIEVDGKVRAYSAWQDANDRISQLLFPAHVAPCFFFDGEQAQARVEASGGLVLSDAVNALFGTGILDQLSTSLRSYISGARASVKGDLGGIRIDELERKRARRDELEETIATIRGDFDECRRKHDEAEAARVAKLTELQQLVGDATVDIQHVATTKNDLEREKEDLSVQLRDALAGLALPLAFKRLAPTLISRLESEIAFDRWIILRDETTRKADDIIAKALPKASKEAIVPSLTKDQQTQLEARFRSALSILWSPPPKGWDDGGFRFTFLAPSERTVTRDHVHSLSTAPTTDAGRLATEWAATSMRLREVERKWELIRDVKPKLEAIKDEINRLSEDVKKLFTERSRLEMLERGHQSELRDLKAAIGQMEKVKRDLDPVHDRLDVANRVREAIDVTRSALLPLCRQTLQDRCTEHFRRMISEEYKGCSVGFDDAYQPFLSTGGKQIYITTLSGAQKRAFGLAFTLAVADVTEQQAPLVIDTPVGNMDSEYRLRILKYLAEHSPGQLILLSHNEEIYGQYAEALKPWVAQRFLVGFEPLGEGAGLSTVAKDRYFTEVGV